MGPQGGGAEWTTLSLGGEMKMDYINCDENVKTFKNFTNNLGKRNQFLEIWADLRKYWGKTVLKL